MEDSKKMEINMHAILSLITVLIICFILGDFSIIKYMVIGLILMTAVFFVLDWLGILKD